MANLKTGAALGADAGGNRMNALDWLAMVLLIVGGVNWALVGLFNYDLVARILGAGSMATRIVYIVVGLAAVYSIYLCVKQSRPDVLAAPHQA